MTETRLTISVIIPTFNRAHFVCEAVESLLLQTQVPDEIIVVDDGSTDNTIDALQELQTRAEVLRVLNNPSKGRSSARNTGIDHSTGSVIAFLDDDDTLPPNSIQRRMQLLRENAEVDVVYGDALLINDDGSTISRFSEFKPGVRPSGDVFAAFAHDNLAPIHTFMFRRWCIGDSIRFDESLDTLEDHDFWLHLAEEYRFLYANEVFAHYRTHTQMTTLKDADLMRTGRLRVQLKAVDMPAFRRLIPEQKALVYYDIGAGHLMLGNTSEARSWFKRAIRQSPKSIRPYVLIGLSLLGNRSIQAAAQGRYRLKAVIRKNSRWIYHTIDTKPQP